MFNYNYFLVGVRVWKLPFKFFQFDTLFLGTNILYTYIDIFSSFMPNSMFYS